MQHTADQGQTVTIGCQLSDFIKVNRDRRSPSSFLFLFRASRPPSAAWLSRRCGCRFPHLRQDLVGFTSARSCRGDTAYRVDHPLQARYSFPCHFNPPPPYIYLILTIPQKPFHGASKKQGTRLMGTLSVISIPLIARKNPCRAVLLSEI